MTIKKLMPGLALCTVVTLSAYGIEYLETYLFHRAWIESLVIAILLGSLIKSSLRLDSRFDAGVDFGAKTLLEIAVVLLGVAVSAAAIAANGLNLILGIAVIVVIAISASYTLGRAAGLPKKLAILIACGNSICGNSAIAAVAPVIDADSNDIAASIAFTAVLGVVVVLVLPLTVPLLSFSPIQFGIFTGLTVYAVPQVLAATSSASLVSTHIGTLVKLVRVLMLGPVVLFLSLFAGKKTDEAGGEGDRQRPALSQMVPWFIVGFLVLMTCRSFGLIPKSLIEPAHIAGNFLTIMSMAALGLGVDVRSVAQAGSKVAGVVVLSLAVLFVTSFILIKLLGI
jgi:uncharacterized integral membrane protein (TIGR00698 family)